MKYYKIMGAREFAKYAIEIDAMGKFALCCFDEEDLAEVLGIAREMNTLFLKDHPNVYAWHCVREDGISFAFRLEDGDKKKLKKMSLKKYFKAFEKLKVESLREKEKQESIASYAETCFVEDGSKKGRYQKFSFIDVENKRVVKFRYRQSKSASPQPLLIYLHGGGAVAMTTKLKCGSLPSIAVDFGLVNAIFYCRKRILF